MRKGHSILMVSVLLLGMLMLFGCQSKELTSAKVYIQQDDWTKAEEQLKSAVELYPNDAEAHRWLGEAYGRKGKYEDMKKEFEASLAVSPKFTADIKHLTDKYWVQNFNNGVMKVKVADQLEDETAKNEKLNEALNAFNMGIIIDPHRADAYKNIGFVHLKLDNMDDAIKNYEKVIEYEPEDVKVMIQLGSLYYEKKEYEKCIQTMDKILAVEPNNLDALSQKAFAYDSMGQSEKAFESYNEALKKNPDDPDLLFNLGRLHYMKKDYDNAIKEFEQVLVNSPDDYEATLNIGNAYLSIAEEHMKPIREEEEITEKQINEAKEKAVENYKHSIPYLEKALELKPDNHDLWMNIGVAYINAGMKEKGEEAFKKADELKK